MFKDNKDDNDTNQSLSFHVAGNNRELLLQIQNIMSSNGYVGMKDAVGRYHYLIDGRKGAPYAAKRIREMAQSLLGSAISKDTKRELNAEFYVDAVLGCYLFDQSLRGYILLRHILLLITMQPEMMKTMSKDLYPAAARAFSITTQQVERNIRYCLEKLKENENNRNNEDMTRRLPIVFRHGFPAYQIPKQRILIEGRTRYSNSEAIRELHFQAQQLIRRDHAKLIHEV